MKITICGSMYFYKEMEEALSQLESVGHEVMIPLLGEELPPEVGGGRKINLGQYLEENGGIGNFAEGDRIWDFKAAAIRDHYDKIDWCDAILVVNHEKRSVSGYVGGNTLMEMGLAFYLKKPIYLLNPVSSELLYKQEILGMKPIILDGDTRQIF